MERSPADLEEGLGSIRGRYMFMKSLRRGQKFFVTMAIRFGA